jgi:DNA-binding transcriptional regulator YhcF (GntR family)
MATTTKVFIQEGDQVIELTGADKEAFIADRKQSEAETKAQQTQAQAQKEVKISAYTKLGLTEEEINAIL